MIYYKLEKYNIGKHVFHFLIYGPNTIFHECCHHFETHAVMLKLISAASIHTAPIPKRCVIQHPASNLRYGRQKLSDSACRCTTEDLLDLITYKL